MSILIFSTLSRRAAILHTISTRPSLWAGIARALYTITQPSVLLNEPEMETVIVHLFSAGLVCLHRVIARHPPFGAKTISGRHNNHILSHDNSPPGQLRCYKTKRAQPRLVISSALMYIYTSPLELNHATAQRSSAPECS